MDFKPDSDIDFPMFHASSQDGAAAKAAALRGDITDRDGRPSRDKVPAGAA